MAQGGHGGMRKQAFAEDEIAIFDWAVIYLRGEHWQFRMWLPGEGKYARRSLNTRHQGTAIERGRDLYLDIMARLRAGKRYFSINAKQAAERYLAHRQRDVDAGLIVPGRWATMRTHLNHWLDFVGRDTRLSELDRGSCEDYHRSRLAGARGVAARQVTIANEQSTINAMMLWLFRQGDSQIDGFDFRKMPRLDRNDEAVRRSTFEAEEVAARICKQDLNEVIAAFVQDKTAVERGLFDPEMVPEELTQVRMGKIIKDRYPELDDADQEAVRQHAIAALNLNFALPRAVAGLALRACSFAVTWPGSQVAIWMLLVCRTPPRSDLFDAPLRSRLIVVSLLPKAPASPYVQGH